MSSRKLFLVAGPSGCGKSAFIELLAANGLDAKVAAAMPADSAGWPMVEANNILKMPKSQSALMPLDGRAILHYDITFIHRFAMTDYAQDPFCASLFSAEQIDVIYIKPDKDRLIHQFIQRRNAHRKTKSRPALLWADWVRLPLKRARLKLQGLPTLEAHELYAMPGFLDDCYASWEVYLQKLTASDCNCRVTIIEPANGDNGNPSFRLQGSF